MILLIDNYDSFTYNLAQALGELGQKLVVVRNDDIDIPGIARLRPERLVISPGPGTPAQAGVSIEAIRAFAPRLPVLGVCLGHQAIAAAFGGRIVRARSLMHGKTSAIHHDGKGVFAGLPNPFDATRYHSLLVEPRSLPAVLSVTAKTAAGEIMGLRHRVFPTEGVQFHPESILTREGKFLLANFLRLKPPAPAARARTSRGWSA